MVTLALHLAVGRSSPEATPSSNATKLWIV